MGTLTQLISSCIMFCLDTGTTLVPTCCRVCSTGCIRQPSWPASCSGSCTEQETFASCVSISYTATQQTRGRCCDRWAEHKAATWTALCWMLHSRLQQCTVIQLRCHLGWQRPQQHIKTMPSCDVLQSHSPHDKFAKSGCVLRCDNMTRPSFMTD